MRTVSFICESCVFAYLGLAIFSFPHRFEVALVVWSAIFILIGRALNIFPLAMLCNRFRQHQITKVFILTRACVNVRKIAIPFLHCVFIENDVDYVVLWSTRGNRLCPLSPLRVPRGNQESFGYHYPLYRALYNHWTWGLNYAPHEVSGEEATS